MNPLAQIDMFLESGIYDMLHRQFVLEGVLYGTLCIIGIILTAVALKFVYSKQKKEARELDSGDFWGFVMIMTSFAGIFLIGMCLRFLTESVLKIVNTEYYIIHDILKW